jgi:parallel beta-helix repeat protein
LVAFRRLANLLGRLHPSKDGREEADRPGGEAMNWRAMGMVQARGRRRLWRVAASIAAAWLILCAPAADAAGTVRNLTQQTSHDDLATALGATRDGDVVELSGGPFVGSFVVGRRITLRGTGEGDARPVLDGGGAGTVLAVEAAGAAIENLAIRNSGRTDSPFALWGDAGVAVRADGVGMRGLAVSGNDWGVLFFPGTGSSLSGSDVSDNVRDGVRIMGGRDHLIDGNTIDRNATGVSIDAFYPDRETPLVFFADPAVVKDYAEKREHAPLSSGNLIRANSIAGNGFYGVTITWDSHGNRVEDNVVTMTGRVREVDPALIRAWEVELAKVSGIPVTFDRDPYGSGISLFCLAHENRIERNRVFDNLAYGIILDLADRNAVAANRVETNRSGILVAASSQNEILRNRVDGNQAYGVRIGVDSVIKQVPADNLVAMNALTRNAVNAFDSSGRVVTAADIEAIVDTLPLPQIIKDQMAKNPIVRQQMINAYLAQMKPAANRWDDGTLGNHHDDFDEEAEGFRDRDGDGISEAGKPIPGGKSVDRHPLTAARVESLLAP